MAVWLARPPASVAKAWTLCGSRAAVSLGVRSWARTMTGSLQVLELLAAMAEQVAQDGLFDVEQVGGAGGEVAAIDALQCLGVAAHDAADGVLGREAMVLDQILDLAARVGSSIKQGMGAEDGAVLAAELFADGLLVFAGLSAAAVAMAWWSRLTSSSRPSPLTKRCGMRNHSVSSTSAGPMATPGETAMPRLISMTPR